MIGADLLRLATQGFIAVALLAGFAEVWMLGVLSIGTGIGGGFFGPAATGLLPEVVPAEELQQANALRSTASSAGEIAGPILAGVVVAAAGPGWAFAVDAGTFAASAVWLSMLGVPGRERAERTSFFTELRDGWRAFSSRSWVWTFVLYFAIGNMLWHAFMVLGPVVADRDLGGAAAWGAVLGAFGIGALAGSLLAVRAEPHRPLIFVALTEGLFMLPLAFLAATEVVAVLAAGSFLAGMGMMLGESVWESTLQRHVPGETLSRVSSYDWFGSMAFTPIGLAAWGPIAALVGISTSLWIAFGLMAASVCALLAVPAIRQLPAFPLAAPR
jgi:MFS family permease